MENKEKSHLKILAPIALVLFFLIVVSSTASAATLSSKSPVADFSAAPISGSAPLKVAFTDKSTGSPTSYIWNFGDKSYSKTKNVIHTYNKVGKYSVTLMVKNAKGSSTKTKYITVSNGPVIKIAYPQNGATVHISETVTGTATNIPIGYKIWVLVYPHPANRYYPQSGKMTIQNGKWSIPVYIGVANNVGVKFDIIVVVANKQANDKFVSYIQTGKKTNNWPGMIGIPSGAKVYNKITVTRV
jgi:PKD repeat protein